MAKYGTASKAHLADVHPDLQRIFNKAIEGWDNQIIDGRRSYAEQVKNVAKGVSKTMKSKHLEGKAVDAMPYPVDWINVEKGLRQLQQFVKTNPNALEVLEAYMFQGFIAGIAHTLGIKIRQGVDWNSNREFEDQTFHDLPHTELVD